MNDQDSNEMTITPEPIEGYCRLHSTPPSSAHFELAKATYAQIPNVAHMQVGQLEGNFLQLIVSLMDAKTALEFGTFTGYSALSIASGLSDGGKVTTLDIDPRATKIAREFWEISGKSEKIELILGDAKKTVLALESEISSGSRKQFDFAFIDADKGGYEFYYESCLKLVRNGGAIMIDNVLWSGRVLNPVDQSDLTINRFNQKIKNDSRVMKVMLPIRDGIFLLQKL